MFLTRKTTLLAIASAGMFSAFASAEMVDTFDDYDTWQKGAGEFTTIDFTEILFPGFLISDFYADQGVTFAGWNVNCEFCNIGPLSAFPQDGWGVNGGENVDLRFSQPMQTFGAHFPFFMDITLYNDDEVVFSGTFGDNWVDQFAGFVSEKPFDRVVLHNPDLQPFINWTYVDNIYFGPPIPAPGVLGVFLVGALAFTRRRRYA